MHVVDFVDKCEQSVGVFSDIHQEFVGGKGHERVLDVAHLQYLRLTVRVLRHHVELDVSLVSGQTHTCLLGHRERLETSANRLQRLVQETCLVRVDANVKHEHKCRHCGFANRKIRRGFNVVGAVQKLRPSFAVKTFSELVRLANVILGNFVFHQTNVALGLRALLQPCKIWIHV